MKAIRMMPTIVISCALGCCRCCNNAGRILLKRLPVAPRFCAEQERLLDELLAEDLAGCITADGALQLAPLMAMSGPRRAALLRRWLAAKHAPMPSRDGLERIWQEVALAREDAAPCLRFGEYDIRRYQSQLWWIKSVTGQSATVIPWPSWQTPLSLPVGLGTVRLVPGGDLRMPRADEPVSIRFKASGLLHIIGRNGGRKLKKIWQELGVPPWRRDTTPLLFYGETLIAAAGILLPVMVWRRREQASGWNGRKRRRHHVMPDGAALIRPTRAPAPPSG